MMLRFTSLPFLKASESVGAGYTGVPAAGGSDSAPMSRVGQSSDAPHPLDARSRSILSDDDGDLLSGTKGQNADNAPRGKGAESTQTTPSRNFFEKGFDPSTLEAPLQGVYNEMKAALDSRLSSLPDSDTLSLVSTKSTAFDRLVAMPEFQKWAEQMTGEKAQPSVGGAAAQDAGNLLEGLDEDVRSGIVRLIQETVDREVANRVTPVADAFYAREADSTINSVRQEFGAEDFDRLAPHMQTIMEGNPSLDVRDAFKLAKFDELRSLVVKREQETVEKKFGANMEGDGSFGTEPKDIKVRSPRDAVSLALDMIRRGDPRAFDPTRLPPGYRGE